MKPKNVFEQLSTSELRAVGMLVGVDEVGPSFRNFLRDISVMADGWTLGDVARAYLMARMKSLGSFEVLDVAKLALGYIDAIPKQIELPTMPGFDRDWADTVIAQASA